ncbi:DUF1345 domain-containing protein [Novosphingobium sp. KCTC 2891]|uniref:DUF1345 domain-containing protein n=1 Tax=Novosphingobium sp. KCTC 2891 TaxID=2989730 RepID=UPI0022214530|nr:DUF1345 domain-containing protein [Novosphingobium sp. KCTC 2891]MCW1382173.1 DUF1345 domain-containing protein [Novosphingobium sp. KCTC 2891]
MQTIRRLRLGEKIAPPRFILFLVLLVAGFFGWRALTGAQGFADPLAMGFDFAAIAFLVSLWPLLRDCDIETMRRHSEENDANRVLILLVTSVLTVVVMAAIAGELPLASKGDRLAMARLIGTLALTWFFANGVYALHYAHLYYTRHGEMGADAGGLDIPGTTTPDYLDFAYFAFTLGMTFQTSDIEITSRAVRRIATLHSFAAFVFNIGVIAFTINALGGS